MNQPIIVLGKERSGTKWLSNLIANHRDVACIQSNYHNGILETNMFDKMENVFGDLRIKENRIAFEHVFMNTSFFKLTDISTTWLLDRDYPSYIELFELMMNEYTNGISAKRWVQKSNSLLAEKLLNHFSDAKFIVIQRGLLNNVVSTLNMKDYSFDLKSVVSSVFGYVYNQKYENKFRNRDNFLFISYDDLKTDTENCLKGVYHFLNLTFQSEYCKVLFAKNTSFNVKERMKFSLLEKLIIKILYHIANISPFFLLNLFRKTLHKSRKNDMKFVKGTFSI